MELKVLFIEDDEKLGQGLKKNFDGETISGYQIKAEVVNVFEEGITSIQNYDFDLVILDLYKDKKEKDEEAGIKVLNQIRQNAFIPVIFYTGHAYKITDLVSEIVGVVSKGDGIEALTAEIERIIASKIALIKGQIYSHLKESLRKYFWETVDTDKKVFVPGKNDVSLGYLLLRRFANSLSKENIKQLLGDDKIKIDKAHPMEFYIYPINPDSVIEEYQTGEILFKDDIYYVILTPICDLALRSDGKRKADKILLASTIRFDALPDYVNYDSLKKKSEKSAKEIVQLSNCEGIIKKWMNNRGGEQDRYFFLPTTPFITNHVIDFQNKSMVSYEDLKLHTRVAKLDDPFAQSMVSSFIRYYNRIGFPDIDSDYVIKNL